ncbi:MAG: hypothetical protein C4522_17580 [Desulfobacteraceae bacterium]|nr:MAG: hypothetical protein C4522_17580 [Desulfobacteraceae bacterium]
MNTFLIIAVSILLAVSFLLAILLIVYSGNRRKIEKIVQEKFTKEELLCVNTKAAFLGIQSTGGRQIRGNGAIVLTREALFFIRAVPCREYKIPIRSIKSVTMPRSFNGKSVLVPLLCVTYDMGEGEDSMAWALTDVMKWKAAIERMTG